MSTSVGISIPFDIGTPYGKVWLLGRGTLDPQMTSGILSLRRRTPSDRSTFSREDAPSARHAPPRVHPTVCVQVSICGAALASETTRGNRGGFDSGGILVGGSLRDKTGI